MADNIELKKGVYSFGFSGFEGPGWHAKGRQVSETASPEEWRIAGGHNFEVTKRPVEFKNGDGLLVPMPNRFVMARTDNDYPLGIGSNVYQIVQPATIDDMLDEYASMDDRLGRSSIFTLQNGERIYSTYAYRDPVSIAGDKHNAFLMGGTCFDGTGSTDVWIAIIRAVCENTVEAGLGSTTAKVKVRHNGKLDPNKVRKDLARLAQQIDAYKAIGDALAGVSLSAAEVSAFFKLTLDIPAEAKPEDVSTRKMNQFADLQTAYKTTRIERNGVDGTFDAFTAWQAALRYADHDRGVKADGIAENIARFDSANFGSGNLYKNRAAGFLLPFIQDKVAIAA